MLLHWTQHRKSTPEQKNANCRVYCRRPRRTHVSPTRGQERRVTRPFYTHKTTLGVGVRSRGGDERLQSFRGLVDSVNHLLGRDVGEGLQTFQWIPGQRWGWGALDTLRARGLDILIVTEVVHKSQDKHLFTHCLGRVEITDLNYYKSQGPRWHGFGLLACHIRITESSFNRKPRYGWGMQFYGAFNIFIFFYCTLGSGEHVQIM